MVSWLLASPGRMYVVAMFLPLAAFALLLTAGGVRALCRPARESSAGARFCYFLLGGHRPLRLGAILATLAMALATVFALIGLSTYLRDASHLSPLEVEHRWAERMTWAAIGERTPGADRPASVIELGYRIDHLSAILFAMVTFVGTCIFVFSIGYMNDEREIEHEDHQAHVTRPGRFGRFFLFLSLFCFSMLNLLIADNLFQIFVSWELVGVCSFFLIGFYFERKSAGMAANKAFLMNRIGDGGFLIGLALAWVWFGTFNIQDIARDLANGQNPMPPELFTILGLGIFLGCVGKSAQFPLHTWLPDAMEGPTPVSALIHAATMVAAGVYLVGRAYPLFTPDVRLVIAYTGAITLFLGATIALVQTDIKRVLAYSTVSQLGYMMLALGVGGWVAGLLHLLTHAFFKALLFLGSGSVIHGCHHEQDMSKMGGLRRKMPVTAFTMLVGVLAIVGTPLFSGWYSKDMILSNAMGFALAEPKHMALFVVPLFTAGLTAFYMFRLWFLTFAGEPRDHHVADHAHESPWVMTGPLILLAVLSVGVAWGWPVWEPHASHLAHLLEEAQPGMAHGLARENHLAGWLALAAALSGTGVAVLMYVTKAINPAAVRMRLSGLHDFLLRKWGFDELYDALFVRPALALGVVSARFDKRVLPGEQAHAGDRSINLTSLDGALSAIGQGMFLLGRRVRSFQGGRIRRYVTVAILLAIVLLGALSVLTP